MSYTELSIEARYLSANHMGMEALLPGTWDYNNDGSPGPWVDTWAPITLIQIKKDRTIKVRRHPDGHTDHTLELDTVVHLRGELQE